MVAVLILDYSLEFFNTCGFVQYLSKHKNDVLNCIPLTRQNAASAISVLLLPVRAFYWSFNKACFTRTICELEMKA